MQKIRRIHCLPLVLILPLTGCATIGASKQIMCQAFSPIYVHMGDSLSDATAKEILVHDLTGAKLCGWKQRHGKQTSNMNGN